MTTDRVVEVLEDKNACSECACDISDSICCEECEEAIKIAIEAVKDIEKYKKAIEDIKADIEPYEYEDKYESVIDDMTGWILAIDVVKVIDKHIKGVKS